MARRSKKSRKKDGQDRYKENRVLMTQFNFINFYSADFLQICDLNIVVKH